MDRLCKSLIVFGCCWATVQAQRHRLQELVPEDCPVCECPSVSSQPDEEEVTTVQILVFDSPGIIAMVKENAQDYEALQNNTIRIQVRTTPTMPELYAEIESDARSGGGLFDAYFTNPIIIGTAAVLGGFLDLAPFIKKDGTEWTDVLPVFRTHVTNFQDKIYMILLDGDIHALFYRRDVLEHFGLTVPRTWDEYIQVAKSVHGKVYDNITLSGSCISRIYGDHAQYWAHLVLATITQTKGTSQGSLFDTKDLTPLTGEAMAEMLRIHEEMATYGTPDEFDKILNHVHNAHMNDGSCVLTYSWGDLYKRSRAQGSVLGDKLGIAPTPGSKRVLDRETGQLVECTKDICPYGEYYDDIGWVNKGGYAANGGWGGAISANADPAKQQILVDFFLWSSGREQSEKYVIPNATLPIAQINGQDPWRKSHLDTEKWVLQGYDRTLTDQFVKTIFQVTQSKNVAIEIRFPKSGEIMSTLDFEVNKYLVRAVKEKTIAEEDKHEERLKVAEEVTRKWNLIIQTYDTREDTLIPILEIYQQLRGVEVPNEQLNQIDHLRPIGLALFALIGISCFVCAFGVFRYRGKTVVKASQPVFLYLLTFGVFTLGSSIIPLSIDDSLATVRGCSMACMSTVWLVCTGFTITFASLFSKIWRLGKLVENSRRCRRVVVKEKDVIIPLIVLLTLNLVLLIVWTLVDPRYWERVSDGRSESGDVISYGQCASPGTTSVVTGSLLLLVNFVALALANIQSYRNRNIVTDFNEGQYIALIMISFIQLLLIGAPILVIAQSNPSANYIVSTLLVFLVCMSVLGLTYIPKVMLGRKTEEHVHQEIRRSYAAPNARFTRPSQSFNDASIEARLPKASDTSGRVKDSSSSFVENTIHEHPQEAPVSNISSQGPDGDDSGRDMPSGMNSAMKDTAES